MAAQRVMLPPMLPWNIDYSPLANDISASSLHFTEVEPCLIYVTEFMRDFLSIHLLNSLKYNE